MRQRPLNAILLLLSLCALILGFASTHAPAYADGNDPPPIHIDPGDTIGGGSSVPDYPSDNGESSLSSEAEPDLWDVVLFTLRVIL
ncbi:MAG: hypothetical protein KAV87_26300 [Desulfobacteraceae bacterium]|nr:hypothetical protein [Desulfobacteraceae bacterium]